MEADELRRQVEFGLENLDKVFQNIQKFSADDVAQDLKVSTLAQYSKQHLQCINGG